MPTLAPGLARKAKKILETKTEDPDLLASLATLSTFYTENGPVQRRKLRSTIERKGLEVSSELLASAESILGSLDSLQSDLQKLEQSCQKINQSLVAHRTSTSGFLSLVTGFEEELQANNKKSEVVRGFLKKYQLSPDEVAVIQEGEPDEEFFSTLARVQAIHENCKELLRTQHQRAGLELMDTMAVYQETGYERLSRWVQGQCRDLADAEADEITPFLKKGVNALATRSTLYQFCVDELATTRHNALYRRFISALTCGQRPIELHADDPKRYINDMLAWVHQALVSERELAVSLFGDKLHAKRDGKDAVGSDELPSLEYMMDKIFESVGYQLKVRIEQVLIASPPIWLCFQLAQLLKFYADTISGIVNRDFNLVMVLCSCQAMASRISQEQLHIKGEKLIRNPPPVLHDLLPPPQVLESMTLMKGIVESFDKTIESTHDENAVLEVSKTIYAIVDPLIEACNQSSEALAVDAPTRLDETSSLDPSARVVFLLNCLSVMHQPLAEKEHLKHITTSLETRISTHLQTLVEMERRQLLAECGMLDVEERMREYLTHAAYGEGTMAADNALTLDRISKVMQAYFALLSKPDAFPEFGKLRDMQQKQKASSDLAQSLYDAYSVVYNAVVDPTNGYAHFGGVSKIRHTLDQVRTILCIK